MHNGISRGGVCQRRFQLAMSATYFAGPVHFLNKVGELLRVRFGGVNNVPDLFNRAPGDAGKLPDLISGANSPRNFRRVFPRRRPTMLTLQSQPVRPAELSVPFPSPERARKKTDPAAPRPEGKPLWTPPRGKGVKTQGLSFSFAKASGQCGNR